jgi:hypothetical protein
MCRIPAKGGCMTVKQAALILYGVSVLILNPAYAGDDYARINGWDFCNWRAGQATWEIFQRTFIGVRDDDLMDVAHWEILYEPNISEKAHCFGMCLLSLAILKEDGHLGFCKPVHVYDGDAGLSKPFSGPTNPDLADAILIMNGHQFGHTMINWITERVMSGDFKNAKVAYEDVKYYLSTGDLPMISIINKPEEGHAMVPYRCEKKSSSEWRIYVYDPNRPYRIYKDYYDLDSNYIEIIAISGGYEWSFMRDEGRWPGQPVWTGNSLSGLSFIFAYPHSEVLQPQRNPFELGAFLEDLNEVFVAGRGGITQISNNQGERLFKTDGDNCTREPEDDPGLRINNVVAFPFVGGTEENLPDAYIIKEYTGNDLKIDVESTGECYQFYMAGRGRLIKVEARSDLSGNDAIDIRNINTDREELTIESERGSVRLNIELLRPGPDSAEIHLFRISDLRVPRAGSVSVKLAEDGDALFMKSRSPVQCDLEIVKSSGDEKLRFEQKQIKISTSEWQRLAWTDLNMHEDTYPETEKYGSPSHTIHDEE